MTAGRIPVDDAMFDVALYSAEIIEDPESHHRFFTDAALFKTLQSAAIEARIAELEKTWPWVDRLGHTPGAPEDEPYSYWQYVEAGDSQDPARGATIDVHDEDMRRVSIKEGVLRPAGTRTGAPAQPSLFAEDVDGADETGDPETPGSSFRGVRERREAERDRLCAALASDRRASLAVALLALLGCDELNGTGAVFGAVVSAARERFGFVARAIEAAWRTASAADERLAADATVELFDDDMWGCPAEAWAAGFLALQACTQDELAGHVAFAAAYLLPIAYGNDKPALHDAIARVVGIAFDAAVPQEQAA
jgi:hypothetical protein